MKKVLFLFAIFVMVFISFYNIYISKLNKVSEISKYQNIKMSNSSISPTSTPTKTTNNIFVPYWNVPINIKDLDIYDEIYYFSLSISSEGINKTNTNWSKFNDFSKLDFKSKYLTISMLDQNQNYDVLKDKKWQKLIIGDSVSIAKTATFSGIILDLEMSPSLSKLTPGEITSFVADFYKASKQSNLRFYITLYGDNFYRVRPYDLVELNKYCDKFLIMAYDLHKASGEPGPNFPLNKGEKYPYDLKTLTETLLTIIPPQKIEYIFGMYGYNWIVNEDKKPFGAAKSMSYLDIKKNYLDKCEWKNCVIKRDDLSTETEIDYIDSDLNYRIVWFEDMTSVNKKIEYLKSKNILNFSFWSFGYF